jgi:UDPglucose--hexose-1-phosphate uridylyltransferase
MDKSLPHRRYNPLTDEWVLVSPQRATRPWLGAVEKVTQERRPEYDPKCYLCPGNTRANSMVNPDYTSVYVFDNDFPALLGIENEELRIENSLSQFSLLNSQLETGVCRVICFSPRHDLTLAELPVEGIRAVVEAWVAQCEELGVRDDIAYVQLFENKGEIMGCSNPHPHGQLWATRHVPTEIAKETRCQSSYFLGERDKVTGRQGDKGTHLVSGSPGHPLLLDYLDIEQRDGSRIIFENEHFVCLVPFWAVWPFETMILPKRHVRHIVELSDAERDALADALKRIAVRYDNLFEVSFPYTMGVHQAPYDGEPHEEWQLHLHFYPPLLRSATVKKFMVGYEMLAQPQRDLTAEQAAERLRGLMEVRFDT